MIATTRPASPAGRAPPGLVVGSAVFLAALLYLVASSLTRRSTPDFVPSTVGASLGDPLVGVTLTVEARHEVDWRYLDLDSATILAPGDSTGWDLAIRRFRIRGAHPVRPSVEAGGTLPQRRGTADPPTGDFGKWYRYGMLSHLLEPLGRSYLVPTDAHGDVAVEILGYYCTGLDAGCLTLRVQVPPAPGRAAP